MTMIYNEYRTENLENEYPFKYNDQINNNYIVDAVFWLEPPVILKKITRDNNYVNFFVNNGIYWRYNISSPIGDYLFNDYGKIILGDISELIEQFPGFVEEVNIPFLDSLCYPDKSLSLVGLNGDIVLVSDADIDTTENNISLSLPLTDEFNCDCLQSLNNEIVIDGNAIIAGDDCTQITGQEGNIYIEDICLPPCYNCNERLTTGDVKQKFDEVDARITALETP